jgi:hypothetical protein
VSNSQEHETIPMEKARSGETSGHMRVVLVVSTVLAVICLAVVAVSAHWGSL